MTDDADPETKKKSGSRGLLIGAAMALLMGGAGFYAVWSGLILSPGAETAEVADSRDGHAVPLLAPDDTAVAFVPVEPLVISLSSSAQAKHLRFRAQIETAPAHSAEVEHLMPRIVDVMNGYLRAVDPATLDAPGALVSLRAQLLRRVELVVGAERVRDVLVMEFVLS